MNVRAFLVVPAALAVAVLTGCGQTDGGSSSGAGSAQIQRPLSEVCHASDEAPVDDFLSPLKGDR